MYVIGDRLLVHCTEGNCSLEVPLLEVYLLCTVQMFTLDWLKFFSECQ